MFFLTTEHVVSNSSRYFSHIHFYRKCLIKECLIILIIFNTLFGIQYPVHHDC